MRSWLHTFYEVYHLKDDYGRGRFCMLMATVITGVSGNFVGGVFYTRFLLANNIDQTGVGILSFLPYIGCLVSILSPYIIERFPRRKWLLFWSGLVTNFISIVGITALPMLVEDAGQRLVGFVIISVSANVIANLFSAAGGAWDAAFLPEKVRPDYMATSAVVNNLITWGSALAVSVVADALSGTEEEMTFIVIIRCVGFGLTVVNSCLLLVKREFPYVQRERVRLSNVFRLPLRNKLFLGTMALAFGYTFVANLPNATINVWLLEDVGISYTLINGLNALFFVFNLIFAGMWAQFIKKHGWFITFAIGIGVEAITYLAYAFVTADCVWLYVLVRIAQHFTGVPVCVVSAAFVYINLPHEDTSYFVTFAGLVSNMAVFLAMFVGTAFTDIMGGRTLSVFGQPFVAMQILLLVCSVGRLLLSVLSVKVSDKLSPARLPR